MNQLLGIADIGEFLGLNQSHGYWLSWKGRLPRADMEVGKRKFWEASTIRDWAREQKVGKYKYL